MAIPWPREALPMSKKSRYPGIEIMSDGRKRVRLRAVDPRTGRMKEVDRIIEGTIEEAVRLRETLRLEVRAADQCAVEVPRLGDYATSWLKSRALAVKPSTATSYADHLELHIIPALGKYYIDKLTPEDMRAFQSR